MYINRSFNGNAPFCFVLSEQQEATLSSTPSTLFSSIIYQNFLALSPFSAKPNSGFRKIDCYNWKLNVEDLPLFEIEWGLAFRRPQLLFLFLLFLFGHREEACSCRIHFFFSHYCLQMRVHRKLAGVCEDFIIKSQVNSVVFWRFGIKPESSVLFCSLPLFPGWCLC